MVRTKLLTWQVFPKILRGVGPGGLSFTNTVWFRTLCPNWHNNLSCTRAQSLLELKHAIATTATKRLKTSTTYTPNSKGSVDRFFSPLYTIFRQQLIVKHEVKSHLPRCCYVSFSIFIYYIIFDNGCSERCQWCQTRDTDCCGKWSWHKS